MAKFFEMGGYAIYVWPAFAVAALVMIGLLVASLRTLRAREAVLRRLEAAQRGGDERA
jgi:heme exporter protein D